jgi:hypothetical protein
MPLCTPRLDDCYEQSADLCIFTVLRHVVIQCWSFLAAFITCVWHCRYSVPSRHTAITVISVRDKLSLYAKSSGRNAFKIVCRGSFSDIEWSIEWSWGSDRQWFTFRHNGTLTTLVICTQRVFSMRGKDFTWLGNPFIFLLTQQGKTCEELFGICKTEHWKIIHERTSNFFFFFFFCCFEGRISTQFSFRHKHIECI